MLFVVLSRTLFGFGIEVAATDWGSPIGNNRFAFW
jgi:hypothetical protein